MSGQRCATKEVKDWAPCNLEFFFYVLMKYVSVILNFGNNYFDYDMILLGINMKSLLDFLKLVQKQRILKLFIF